MDFSLDRTQNILTLLVVGIINQNATIKPENSLSKDVLHPYIRDAWDYISLVAYLNSLRIPSTITDFVNILHTPVEGWEILGEHCLNLGLSGSILTNEGISPQFQALAEKIESSYKPHLEFEDHNFRKIYDLCKQHEDKQSYTALRMFLNQNPYYRDLYAIKTPEWQEQWEPYLAKCYELIPSNCIQGKGDNRYIVTCPHCGWVLIWNRDGEASCHEGGACEELYHPLSHYGDIDEQRVSYQEGMLRTKEGIQRYVVSPEVALIEIYDALRQEWNVQCELFPNIDSYDLLVKLPNGDRWAVDVKDWGNPISLAIGLADKPFRYLPEWDRAFYVFPKYRATPSYLNEFGNYWNGQHGVKFMGQNQFVRAARRMSR